ncbi:Uncharacterised protein [Serratia fonticola]|jgi:hypothetical protein|nr:Uncharacterised protein [Serratia fonticola]
MWCPYVLRSQFRFRKPFPLAGDDEGDGLNQSH